MFCIEPEGRLEGSWEMDEVIISLITTKLTLFFIWFSSWYELVGDSGVTQ